jgi:ATP-binding cassette subfamily A (ABC1) protein 3
MQRLHADEEENSHTNSDNNNNNERYLSDGHHQQPAVQIRNLRKVYSGGKVAVEGLTLDLYEDHITALLGHNGAGKSTTISMLTGLIRPSSGDALIWGHSIRQDMNNIRRTIGVCPQQNVLFNYLTVKEHLELFASLKGVPKLYVDEEVQDMVTRLGLEDKLHAQASNLSGGMKRKLQMGLAMIGGSRVVFLDEPTSGLDPQSRRSVWELLQRFKAGRAIVLTTHYMDEADLLCDRIAIMSEGRLRCCGSSLFLKAKFGVGYNLSMTRSSIACNDSVVSDLVQRHVPEAVLLSSAGGEMTFQLPFTNKAAFAQLFQELEQQKEALHISGYGVSMTTLEEVFLSLAVDDQTSKNQRNVFSLDKAVNTIQEGGESQIHVHETPVQVSNGHQIAAQNGNGEPKLNGIVYNGTTYTHQNGHDAVIPVQGFSYSRKLSESSFLRAFFEMFKKRVLIAGRDLKGLINSVLLPVVVISFVMLILKLNIDPAGPELMLNFRMYTPTSSKDSPLKTIVPVVVGAPHSDDALSLLHGNDYLEYYAQDIGLKNSVQLSEQLLETYSLKPARFGKHQFTQVKSKIFDSVFPLDPHVITIALIGLEIFEFVFLFDPCIAKL